MGVVTGVAPAVALSGTQSVFTSVVGAAVADALLLLLPLEEVSLPLLLEQPDNASAATPVMAITQVRIRWRIEKHSLQ